MILRSALLFTLALRAFGGSSPIENVSDEIPWKKGICKNEMQTLQSDFDAEKFFSGVWYEEQNMGALLSHINRKCIAVNNTISGNVVNMSLSEYIPLIFSTVSQNIQVTLDDLKKPTFSVVIPWIGMTILNMPVSILSTDYDNFALLYSCSNAPLGLDGYISEAAFVLRRKRGDKSKALFIRDQAWNNGIIYEDLIILDNDSCP